MYNQYPATARPSRSRGVGAAALAALGTLLLLAPSGHAATATFSGTVLEVRPTADEPLDLVGRPAGPGQYALTFGASFVGPVPAACTLVDDELLCPRASLGQVSAVLGSGDDRVDARGDVPFTVDAGAGEDDLRGGSVADSLTGGVGDDIIDGADGDDVLSGGAGSDDLRGGPGTDLVDGGVGVDLIDGESGADIIDAGPGDDLVTGGDDADAVHGGDGADELDGADGSDALWGDGGGDTLRGDEGADRIDGGDGADRATGGAGDDELAGGRGDDQVAGDEGSDGVAGGDDADTLEGGVGIDVVQGGAGDDAITATVDGDRLQGGDGTDQVSFASAAAGVDIDLNSRRAAGASAVDFFDDLPETIEGSDFDDRVRAADATSLRIRAGAGNDVLIGSLGEDLLDGGDGWDAVDYGARITPLTISASGDAESGAPGERDVVTTDNEVLIGGSAPDVLIGSGGPSRLVGGDGDDRLEDTDGSVDQLVCGAGTDVAIADRADGVALDCERWENGSLLLRRAEPLEGWIRSARLLLPPTGRARVSVACAETALVSCRAAVRIELRVTPKRWRKAGERSFLLVPGRRRNVAVFVQRSFAKQLLAAKPKRPRARITVTLRDGTGRTATTTKIVPVTIASSAR